MFLFKVFESTIMDSYLQRKLVELFDTFDIDDKRDIMNSVVIFNKRLTRIADQHKVSLIGNKNYSFEFNEIQIDDIFGCFKATIKVIFKLIYFNNQDI